MLIQSDNSCVLLIDVQEKLTPLVMEAEHLVNRCAWIMRLAAELKVPLLVSEQYTKGLGHTVQALQPYITQKTDIDKVHFSCVQDLVFHQQWQALNKKQAILIGIETHVCVLETAIELHQMGVEVFIVIDAVSSRHQLDHKYALKRMMHLGIQLVTSEMVFFEWVRQAGTAEFKTLSQQFLR